MANKQADNRQGAGGVVTFFFAALVVLVVQFGAPGAVRPVAAQEKTAVSNTGATSEILAYLENEFCDGGLCEAGAWQSWVILDTDSVWTVAELALLRETLQTTIHALDEAGISGQALLAGYQFRRHDGQYVAGLIAKVNHDTQVVTLADTAVQQLWGFYLYHELGHIVDRRLHLALRQHYHALAGSSDVTADGYWMNEHGRASQGEATADAFGLWVVMRYTENPKPVFPQMPNDTDYAQIASTLETALVEIGVQRNGR